jgi:hypothetical protein
MTLLFSKSRKGAPLLHHKGFTFRKEKSTSSKTVWRCSEYPTRKCLARLHITDEVVVGEINEHNHSCKHMNTTTMEFWKDHNRQNEKFQNTHLQHNVDCNTMLSEFDVTPEKTILGDESDKKKYRLMSEERAQKVMSDQLGELDTEVNAILNKKGLSDEEKAQLYCQVLCFDNKSQTAVAEELSPPSSPTGNSEDVIIQSIPIKRKKVAQEMIRTVKSPNERVFYAKNALCENFSQPSSVAEVKSFLRRKKKTCPKRKRTFRNLIKENHSSWLIL